MRTFKCNFGKGITCTLQVSDDPPEKGTSHIINMEWEGKPKTRIMPKYIAWMNSVNKMLASEWNMKILHCFQITSNWVEAWQYEPNKTPKRVKLIGK